jgi:hypothetical protein
MLINDARTVVRRAWSFRLAVLSAALSGCEVALPYLDGIVPSRTLAALAMVTGIGAAVARIVAQPSMHGGRE